ncbi:MAG: type II toxin-antitoxin system VapB family antitoxin [Actinomycetota bacterium]|nr:type II toxin-antitoxin system VapB family antitoxin [Actinomycetota bacterium]
MRTTINLPDGLAAEAKARAAASGRTFTSLVEEGLRVVLAEHRDAESARHEPLPSYGDPAARPLIDLTDRDAVWVTLDMDADL